MPAPKTVNSRYYEFLELLETKYNVSIPADKVKPSGWALPLPVNKWNYKVVNRLPQYPAIDFIGVGDAIGLAHPILGAGIEPGWQSGWLLAESYNKMTGNFDTDRYKMLLRKNHALTSGRRLDKTMASVMRSRWMPWKDKFGYIGLKLTMNRMVEKMREYPWYAYVTDEHGPIEQTSSHQIPPQADPVVQ